MPPCWPLFILIEKVDSRQETSAVALYLYKLAHTKDAVYSCISSVCTRNAKKERRNGTCQTPAWKVMHIEG